MLHCRICDHEVIDSPSAPICAECARTLGIVPMPPPRRPAQPCAKCNSMKFIRAIPREYATEGAGGTSPSMVAPMALTAHPSVTERLLFKGNEVSPPYLPRQSRGTLETYVCVGCGFLEWYCHDPENIPIGPEYMTDEIDYNSPAPYR